MAQSKLTPLDLVKVIYTSGRVFDGLRTNDLDTRSFLSSGSTEGISSKVDLDLLKDLKALAEHSIAHVGKPVDAEYLVSLNAQVTRSGPLYPGRLRTPEQRIGVGTRFGRHEPPALTREGLQQLVDDALSSADPVENALGLFVDVARAQPFGDGNKRTALFAANTLLLGEGTDLLLSIPYDEEDASLAESFNELLARAYVFGEDEGIKDLLRERGIGPIPPAKTSDDVMADRKKRFPELFEPDEQQSPPQTELGL